MMSKEFLITLGIIIGWIFSVCLHEFGHAIIAYWGGDKSVKEKGYLTFNPVKYTNIQTSLILPVLFLALGGIGLPGGAVYINQSALRNRGWKSAVSLAGPFANILFAVVLSIPFWFLSVPYFDSNSITSINLEKWGFYIGLSFLIFLQIGACFLNLIPVPPLDGYGIIEPWLPESLQLKMRKIGQYGIWFVFGLLWFNESINVQFWLLVAKVTNSLNVPLQLSFIGYDILREQSKILTLLLLAGLFVFRAKEIGFYNKGKQLTNQGKFAESIDQFNQAIKIKPDYFEAWWMKAYSLSCLQRYDEALMAYDKTLDLTPEFGYAWYFKSKIYRKINQFELALQALEKTVELTPNHPSAWFDLGEIYLNQEDYQKALKYYSQHLEIENNSKFYQAWYQKGIVLEHLGNLKEAIHCFEKASHLQPDNISLWYKQAVLLYENQQYQESILVCNQGIEVDNNAYLLWLYRGLSMVNLKQYETALEAFNKVLSLKENNFKAQKGKADCYYHLKNYQQAIEYYSNCTEKEPENPLLWYNLACCYALSNQKELGEECLQKVLMFDRLTFIPLIQNNTDLAYLNINITE